MTSCCEAAHIYYALKIHKIWMQKSDLELTATTPAVDVLLCFSPLSVRPWLHVD